MPTKDTQAGFTLLETLIAIFILGTVLILLYQTLSEVASRAGHDIFQQQAADLIRKKYSRLQAGRERCKNSSGTLAARNTTLKWTTEVRPGTGFHPVIADTEAAANLCHMTLHVFSLFDPGHTVTVDLFVYPPIRRN